MGICYFGKFSQYCFKCFFLFFPLFLFLLVLLLLYPLESLALLIMIVSNFQSDVEGREAFCSFIIIIIVWTIIIIIIIPVLRLLVGLYFWDVNSKCVSQILLLPLGGTGWLEWATVHYFLSVPWKAKAGWSWYFSSLRSMRLW